MANLRIDPTTAEYQMYDNYARSLTLGIGEIDEEKLPLIEWAATHRANLTPDRRFDLITHQYLKALYGEATAPIRVIYKSSQMGASELGISYALWSCDSRNATVLYVFPTESHVTDFSAARIGPAIEASDYLMRIVTPTRSGSEGRRGTDRVKLKRIRNRFLYLRGAKVKAGGKAPQLKSIDADVLVLDEIDEMDHRAPVIAEKRTGHSMINEQLWISTPTYEGFGIHNQWLKSDQKEWFIPCPSCGKKQVMTINSVVTEWDKLERPVHWHGYPDTAWVACVRCGARLDRLVPGEWVATYPSLSPRVSGFHLTKFFSPMSNMFDIVEGLQTTDETDRKELFNQDLGEPYHPRGGRMNSQILDKVKGEYLHEPVPGEQTVMGVDIGRLLHVVIRSRVDVETGLRHQRFAGTVAEFEDLDALVKMYNVRFCVVDALPETRKAREFQASQTVGMVWLAYYVAQKTGLKIPEPVVWKVDETQKGRPEGIVNVDRTRLIDATFSRFYDTINTLPANAHEIPDYYDQLIAPVRVVDEKENVARYVEGTKADHYTHAETYCTIASMGIPPEPASAKVEPDLDIYKSSRDQPSNVIRPERRRRKI